MPVISTPRRERQHHHLAATESGRMRNECDPHAVFELNGVLSAPMPAIARWAISRSSAKAFDYIGVIVTALPSILSRSFKQPLLCEWST